MKFQISKLDAAKRQLDTAIQLFFRNGDPVAIHSLTCAAHEILEGICSKQGLKSLSKQMLADVKPEYQKKFIDIIHKPRNFFKHAGYDNDKMLEFNPETSDFILWDACRMYNNLTSQKIPLYQAFDLWMYANEPLLYVLTPLQKKAYEVAIEGLNPENKAEFLNLIPILEKLHYPS